MMISVLTFKSEKSTDGIFFSILYAQAGDECKHDHKDHKTINHSKRHPGVVSIYDKGS